MQPTPPISLTMLRLPYHRRRGVLQPEELAEISCFQSRACSTPTLQGSCCAQVSVCTVASSSSSMSASDAARSFSIGGGGWETVSVQNQTELEYDELPAYCPREVCEVVVPANAHSCLKRRPEPSMLLHPSLVFGTEAANRLFFNWITALGLCSSHMAVTYSGDLIFPVAPPTVCLRLQLAYHGTSPYALQHIIQSGDALLPQFTLCAGETRLQQGALVWCARDPQFAWQYAPGVDLAHLMDKTGTSGWVVSVVCVVSHSSALHSSDNCAVCPVGGGRLVHQYIFRVVPARRFRGSYLLPYVPGGLALPQ